jgi:hypothetical protein
VQAEVESSMVTAAEVEIYVRFKGDVDMYQRCGSPGDLSDAWTKIEDLRQRLYMVSMNFASVQFATQTESDLLAWTADDEARRGIRALVATDVRARS